MNTYKVWAEEFNYTQETAEEFEAWSIEGAIDMWLDNHDEPYMLAEFEDGLKVKVFGRGKTFNFILFGDFAWTVKKMRVKS